MAGRVKERSNYSPTADAEAAIGRAGVVLQLMAETGAITPEQAADTDPKSVARAPETRPNRVSSSTDCALPQLRMRLDDATAPPDAWPSPELPVQRRAATAAKDRSAGRRDG